MGDDDNVCGLSVSAMGLACGGLFFICRVVCGYSCDGVDRGTECDADTDAAGEANERPAVDHSGFCVGKGFWFSGLLSDRWILCVMR